MIFKVKVEETRYYPKDKNHHHAYWKVFDTKEELGVFILDLVDKEVYDVIVHPIFEDEDYRGLEVYNDYRE